MRGSRLNRARQKKELEKQKMKESYQYTNNKNKNPNDFVLNDKNSNIDYYKPTVTDMEMAGARTRWRYY